jgi:hypothetical protein
VPPGAPSPGGGGSGLHGGAAGAGDLTAGRTAGGGGTDEEAVAPFELRSGAGGASCAGPPVSAAWAAPGRLAAAVAAQDFSMSDITSLWSGVTYRGIQ